MDKIKPHGQVTILKLFKSTVRKIKYTPVDIDDSIRGEVGSKLGIRLPGQSILGSLGCPIPLDHSAISSSSGSWWSMLTLLLLAVLFTTTDCSETQ